MKTLFGEVRLGVEQVSLNSVLIKCIVERHRSLITKQFNTDACEPAGTNVSEGTPKRFCAMGWTRHGHLALAV